MIYIEVFGPKRNILIFKGPTFIQDLTPLKTLTSHFIFNTLVNLTHNKFKTKIITGNTLIILEKGKIITTINFIQTFFDIPLSPSLLTICTVIISENNRYNSESENNSEPLPFFKDSDIKKNTHFTADQKCKLLYLLMVGCEVLF